MSILEKKGIPFSFSNDSEVIVKTLINKIISLSITKSFTSKVDEQLPNYCYEKLKQIIKSYCELQYMSYDRDDGPPPKIKKINPSKSVINDFEISKLSEFKNNNLDESIKSNKSQIEKKINDSFLNFSKDKINEKEIEKIPFENNIEYIEKIDISSLNESNSENNILLNDNDNNLFYDNYFEEKNFWGSLNQPNSIMTDRDASTMIKFSKDIIIDSDRLSNSIKDTKSSRIQNNIFRKKIKKKKNDNENEEKNKKKIILPIEAHDIPIEQFPTLIEGEEIFKLREEKEEEIKLKKIEELKRLQKEEERIQKEKEKNDKLKETPLKDITIDPNGNIIHVKPLNIDQLINEFTYANSNQKHIDKILGEQPKFKRNSLLVEKNPNKSGLIIDMTGKNTKENKKKKNDINSLFLKKRNSINNSLIENNNIKDHNNNNDNNNNNKNNNNLLGNNSLPSINQIPSIIKKSTSQFAAGSNFDLIELEPGVDLRENSKFKSGGKDYFKKYNKYSVENFEKQQNKTQTENFYKTRNEDFRETIYSHNDEYRKTMDNIINNTNREIKNNFLNFEPSEMNNTLHLKTKNLNKALSELDLISENIIKENKIYSKNKPGDLFNKKKLVNMKNYDAMNKFTKTLMGSSSWGISKKNKNLTQENEFIIPKKVLFNNNDNLINFHTRSKKKIVPLNKANSNVNIIKNKMSVTSTNGFYKGKMKKPFKLPKLKEQDFIDMIEKDEENDKKNFVTTHNFYK